jgi:hypothetical protein
MRCLSFAIFELTYISVREQLGQYPKIHIFRIRGNYCALRSGDILLRPR